jgi:hypothetical protein
VQGQERQSRRMTSSCWVVKQGERDLGMECSSHRHHGDAPLFRCPPARRGS